MDELRVLILEYFFLLFFDTNFSFIKTREVNIFKQANKEPLIDIKKAMAKVKENHERLKKNISKKKEEKKDVSEEKFEQK